MVQTDGAPITRSLALMATALACSSCGSGGSAPALVDLSTLPPPSVRVTVRPLSSTVQVGDSVKLSAYTVGAAADTVPATGAEWRSANAELATVSPTGVVVARAPGLAGITAQVRDGVGSARVIVVPRSHLEAMPPARTLPPTSLRDAAQRTEEKPPPPPSRTASVPVTRTGAGAERAGGSDQRSSGVSPRVAAPDAKAGPHPHEPEGFRVLANRGFESKASSDSDRGDDDCEGGSECWDGVEYRYDHFRIIQDRSAPVSCCSVGRMIYTANHRAGTAPATVQTKAFDPRVEALYVSVWARISSNWSGNRSGTNKMFFVGFGPSANQVFLSAEGAGMAPLEAQIRLQGVPDQRARIRPNVMAGAQIVRGKWQHWELYLELNDAGRANGVARLWIDGRLVTDASNVMYRSAGRENAKWWIFHWSPTYGGGGQGPPHEQYLDFDQVYVSGR